MQWSEQNWAVDCLRSLNIYSNQVEIGHKNVDIISNNIENVFIMIFIFIHSGVQLRTIWLCLREAYAVSLALSLRVSHDMECEWEMSHENAAIDEFRNNFIIFLRVTYDRIACEHISGSALVDLQLQFNQSKNPSIVIKNLNIFFRKKRIRRWVQKHCIAMKMTSITITSSAFVKSKTGKLSSAAIFPILIETIFNQIPPIIHTHVYACRHTYVHI